MGKKQFFQLECWINLCQAVAMFKAEICQAIRHSITGCAFVHTYFLMIFSICLAYHLRREDTDWFDKPREGQPQSGHMSDRRQV